MDRREHGVIMPEDEELTEEEKEELKDCFEFIKDNIEKEFTPDDDTTNEDITNEPE